MLSVLYGSKEIEELFSPPRYDGISQFTYNILPLVESIGMSGAFGQPESKQFHLTRSVYDQLASMENLLTIAVHVTMYF